jgi:hypothetical protein
LGGFAW